MSALELWLAVDWQAPEPALRALERCTRAIRSADPARLIVAAGALPEEEARTLLLQMINADPELSGRVASLPQIIVRDGDVPAEVEAHMRLPGPGEQALHVLREGLAPYVALTPVLNQEAWARAWQPEAGFRHLVIDNASDDDTAQILADRGADVIVNDTRLSRVDNWRRALEVFLEIGDADWMKWVFAGDRLLPGAADLLDAALAAQPDARIICAEYQFKHPDGAVTRFHPIDETKLVTSVEALYRFALQGNWMGGPIGLALHRDVVAEIDFGAHSWVADWQASLSLALRHPVLHVNRPIGHFDASRGRFHSAHSQDVSTIIQDAAMRYQALEHLRELAPHLPLAEVEEKIDTMVLGESVRRIKAKRDTDAAPPAARARLEAETAGGGATRIRLGGGTAAARS
jgi:hypothetical protein